MREMLPVVLGVLLGVVFSPARRRMMRVAYPIAVVLTGATASAVNGEIGGNWTALFLSFDMLQVAVSASVASVAMWSWRRRRRRPVHR
jgi:uncharacterized membrane protein YfcA